MTIADLRERAGSAPSRQERAHRQQTVCIPLEEMDGLVRDLYSVGISLTRCGGVEGEEAVEGAAHARAVLDRVITRIHMAAAGLTPAQFHDQPWTGAEPDTIELLDAAHSARRARVILEEALSPPAPRPVSGSI